MMRTGLQSPRPPRARDGGAIAVLGALMLVVLIGMGALVVDGGYLAMRRRAIQGVADAAALAGAYSLPTAATAITEARANATANGYTHGGAVTVNVASPYSSDSRRIEVIIQTNVPTFLGKALKINSGVVRGRAVAKIDSAPEAIFVGSTACGGFGLRVNGSQITINGAMHSNSFLGIYGNNTDTFGATTYVCSQSINGGPNFTAGPPSSTTIRPYPISYTPADFPCTYNQPSGNYDLCNVPSVWQSGNCWGAGGVLKPGVYCAPNGTLTLNGGGLSGNVTFVASQLQISGNNMDLTAHTKGIALYATSNSPTAAIMLGVSTMHIGGIVYAPNGHINMSGTAFTIDGSIIGHELEFGTSNWTINSGGGSLIPYLTE